MRGHSGDNQGTKRRTFRGHSGDAKETIVGHSGDLSGDTFKKKPSEKIIKVGTKEI